MPELKNPARGVLIRSALIFGALTAVVIAAGIVSIYDLSNGDNGAIVSLAVLVIVLLLAGSQLTQAVRDLLAAPVETRGVVARKWRAGMLLFFMRGSYMLVSKKVFQVNPAAFEQVDEGDTVRLTHYPHTNTIVIVEVVERRPGSERRV